MPPGPERVIRTLEEQLSRLARFDPIAELLNALHHFTERFNVSWLVQRHGDRTPADQRLSLLHSTPAAAAR